MCNTAVACQLGNSLIDIPSDYISQGTVRRKGCQFLDQEAALSEEDGPVSSDEEDDEEQNRTLEGFVVDNSHLSQGLNGTVTTCYRGD